jgi:hypothetical protein
MCVVWYRSCKQKKKELGKEEYQKWWREIFELPMKQEVD